MFVCYECLKIFDQPRTWTEKHGLDSPPYEVYSGCPYCGGAYAQSYKCDECGEWIMDNYIKTASGQRICENCYNTYEIGEES